MFSKVSELLTDRKFGDQFGEMFEVFISPYKATIMLGFLEKKKLTGQEIVDKVNSAMGRDEKLLTTYHIGDLKRRGYIENEGSIFSPDVKGSYFIRRLRSDITKSYRQSS